MRSLLAILILCGLSVGHAARAELVDLELVLAVDVSGSIDDEEAALQRDGYVKAITDERVLRTITAGRHGRIGVTYVEWAGDHFQDIVVDWAVIEDRSSAEAFAAKLARQPLRIEHWTSISGAIQFAADMLELSPYKGRRRVIDISGDGANNNGEAVLLARERALEKRITINGLPIINGRPSRYGKLPLKDLDRYYRECVIGGTGAFLVVANGFNDFARAIRRKLILEIAGRQPAPEPKLVLASFPDRKPGDCLDGEWNLHWDLEDM